MDKTRDLWFAFCQGKGGAEKKGKKKKKGFSDDIVMLNSVLYAAGRCFFPCLSLSFLLFSKQLNAGVGKCL